MELIYLFRQNFLQTFTYSRNSFSHRILADGLAALDLRPRLALLFSEDQLTEELVDAFKSYRDGDQGADWLIKLNSQRILYGTAFNIFPAKKLVFENANLERAWLVITSKHLGLLHGTQTLEEDFFDLGKMSVLEQHNSKFIVEVCSATSSHPLKVSLTLNDEHVQEVHALLPARGRTISDEPEGYKLSRSMKDIIAKPNSKYTTKDERYRIMEKIAMPTSPQPISPANGDHSKPSPGGNPAPTTISILSSPLTEGSIDMTAYMHRGLAQEAGKGISRILEAPARTDVVDSQQKQIPRNDTEVEALFDQLPNPDCKRASELIPLKTNSKALDLRADTSDSRPINKLHVNPNSVTDSDIADKRRAQSPLQHSRELRRHRLGQKNWKQNPEQDLPVLTTDEVDELSISKKPAPNHERSDDYDPSLTTGQSNLRCRSKKFANGSSRSHDTDYDDLEDGPSTDPPPKRRAKNKKSGGQKRARPSTKAKTSRGVGNALPQVRRSIGVPSSRKSAKKSGPSTEVPMLLDPAKVHDDNDSGLVYIVPDPLTREDDQEKKQAAFQNLRLSSSGNQYISPDILHIDVAAQKFDSVMKAEHTDKGKEDKSEIVASSRKGGHADIAVLPEAQKRTSKLVDEDALRLPKVIKWWVKLTIRLIEFH